MQLRITERLSRKIMSLELLNNESRNGFKITELLLPNVKLCKINDPLEPVINFKSPLKQYRWLATRRSREVGGASSCLNNLP